MSIYQKVSSLEKAKELWPEMPIGQANNLIGQKFDKLLVLYRGQSSYKKEASWVCQCDCGKYVLVRGSSLRIKKTTSCGCNQVLATKKIGQGHFKDLTGQKFGKLTPRARIGTDNWRQPIWECLCDCGKITNVSSHNLLTGHTQSCGCIKGENRKLDLTGQRFGYLIALEPEEERKNGCLLWKCKCLNCGSITLVRSSHLTGGTIKSCGCIKSYGELTIKQFLLEKQINFKTEYSFFDLRDKNPLKFDFAIFNTCNELICLIEYQGEQHYRKDNTSFGLQQRTKTDQMKKDYCYNKQIKLYEIKYNEDINKRLVEILNEVNL